MRILINITEVTLTDFFFVSFPVDYFHKDQEYFLLF
jgi:hypothetical protein